jgi:putative ABC transport system permease protein
MYVSGFTDLIDGIILNMKFGGWMISLSRCWLVMVANIMFVSVKNVQTYRFKNHWAQKTDSYYFSFYSKRYTICNCGGMIGLLLVWIIALIFIN